MNWGKGLAIAMISFMIFILYMVFTLISKTTDLESTDYYKKEIEFEKEIIALQNTNRLKEKVKISQNEDYVVVQFPALEKMDSLKIHLFRPNNEKEDQFFSVEDSKIMLIPIKKLKKGTYDLNLQFKMNNDLYMQKESIVITK